MNTPLAGLTQEQLAALQAKLPAAEVKTREQSGTKLSYVEGHYCIRVANEVFGPTGWTRETLSMTCVVEEPYTSRSGKTGHLVAYVAQVRVNIRTEDGWIATDGYGYGEGIDYTNRGQAHESAVKEAETDAMKRALIKLGDPFGLALYDKQKRNVDTNGNGSPPARPQPDFDAAKPTAVQPLQPARTANVSKAEAEQFKQVAADNHISEQQIKHAMTELGITPSQIIRPQMDTLWRWLRQTAGAGYVGPEFDAEGRPIIAEEVATND